MTIVEAIQGQENASRRSTSRSDDVLAFLQGAFVCGRITVSQLTIKARAAGLMGDGQSVTNSKLFKRAKRALGIRSIRDGFGGKGEWFWVLPDQTTPSAIPPGHVSEGPEPSRA